MATQPQPHSAGSGRKGPALVPPTLVPAHDALRWVVEGVRRIVPACDTAAITVVEEDHSVVVVASDGLAEELDRAQLAAGEGPVLDAMGQFQVFTVARLDTTLSWPRFTRLAVGRGVMSSLTAPITTRGRAVGALSLYSCQPDGLSGHEQVGLTYAARAAVALRPENEPVGPGAEWAHPGLFGVASSSAVS